MKSPIEGKRMNPYNLWMQVIAGTIANLLTVMIASVALALVRFVQRSTSI
jgi:hypothetical protein